MALVQRLTNTGILQTSGSIDETSTSNIAGRITPTGDFIINGAFDETTLSSMNTNYSYLFSSNINRAIGDQGNYLVVDSFSNGFSTSDFTIEFFAKWLSIVGTSNVIVGNWETGSTSFEIAMSSGLDTLSFACRTTTGIDSFSQSITTLSSSKFHHIAVTRTSGVVKFYVNGAQVYSGTGLSGKFGQSIYPPYANKLYINSGNGSGATNRANCYISNLRIIIGTSLYSSSTLTVPTTDLTAVSGTVLLTCQSATLVDNSGLGRTITSYYSSGFSNVIPQAVIVFPPANGVMRRQTATSYQVYDSFDELSLAYTITPNKTIANEGDTITYTINAPLVENNNEDLYPYSVRFNPARASSTAYLQTSGGNGAVLDAKSNNWTVEFWFKTSAYGDTNGNSQIFMDFLNDTTFAFLIQFYGDGATMQIYDGVNNMVGTFAQPFTLNQWNHFALVCNTTLTVYLNGVAQSGWNGVTNNIVSNANTTHITQFNISSSILGVGVSDWYFSQVRVNNSTSVYTGNFTPTTRLLSTQGSETNINPVTSGTMLLTCNGNLHFDISTNSLTITPAGTILPSISYDAPTYVSSPTFNLGPGNGRLYWSNSGSIASADFTGGLVYGVTPLTWAGTATATLWSFIGITQLSTSGFGTGAVFSIRKNNATTAMATYGVLTVIPTSPGSGYTYGDTIVIDGASLGLTSTTNNLTITVGSDWFAQAVAPSTATGTGMGTVTAGAATWTCPDGVYRISVVCVGAGGAGTGLSVGGILSAGGGGGGALSYIQDYLVTPGIAYSVSAGLVGAYPSQGGGASYFLPNPATQATAIYPNTVSGSGMANTGTGTFTWTCPTDVTSISVVCVGGGGGGGSRVNVVGTSAGGGGGGGGLAWKNNITVVPGTVYNIVVGAGGASDSSGGSTYFIDTNTIVATGGSPGQSRGSGDTTTRLGGVGGTYGGTGVSGGTGGTGGSGLNASLSAPGGGGGAAGYTGNGGNGGDSHSGQGRGTNGSGGGGGGGHGGNTGGQQGIAGAGVGLMGQGQNGSTALYGSGTFPQGGSGGASITGSDTAGGAYGGGGVGGYTTTGTTGGAGAIRIVWGGRTYPLDAACCALGGNGALITGISGGAGGTPLIGSGFAGGNGGSSASANNPGGGGGAGGYTSAGGAGGSSSGASPNLVSQSGATSLSGGGGGSSGGGAGGLTQNGTANNATTGGAGSGGGVGLLGISNLGLGGTLLAGTTGAILGQSGLGGSGGAQGAVATATAGGAGGAQGGGGAGGTSSGVGGAGGAGAIRIIWNYPHGFLPETSPLPAVTNTVLLTAQAATPVDSSTINNRISDVFGAALNTTIIPFSGTYSYLFNGTTQYLTVPHSSDFVFNDGVDFTIEGWVYTSATTINKGAFFKRYSGSISGVNFGTSTTTASRFQILVANVDGSGWEINNSTVTFVINTWYHFAITKTNGNVYLYINGTLRLTLAHTTAIYDDGSELNIGRDPNGAFWVGYLSNFRVVNGTALYTPVLYPSGFSTPTTPLTAVTNTKLLTLQSVGFFDNTGINTITSIPTLAGGNTIIPFANTYSYQFNGTSQFLAIPHSSNFVFGAGVDFTIEGYLYTSATTINKGLYYKRSGAGVFSGVNFGTSTTTASRFTLKVANATGSAWEINDETAGPIFAINTWYHFAITKINGVIYLYMNGLMTRKYNHTTAIYDDGSPLTIGRDLGGSFWIGYLSNIRVIKGTALYYPPSTIVNRNYPDYPPVTTNNGSVIIGNGTGIVSLPISQDISQEGVQDIRLLLRSGSTSGTILATALPVLVADTSKPLVLPGGNQCWCAYPDYVSGPNLVYTGTPGQFTFTAPKGYTTVSVVCIGGGGMGGVNGGSGGGGGALAYIASTAVTAGTTYAVVAGYGGDSSNPNTGDANGGASAFNTTTVIANGGTSGVTGGAGGAGGTIGAGTGFSGGAGGAVSAGGSGYSGGGGGGAAGYTVAGGVGGAVTGAWPTLTAGSGAASTSGGAGGSAGGSATAGAYFGAGGGGGGTSPFGSVAVASVAGASYAGLQGSPGRGGGGSGGNPTITASGVQLGQRGYTATPYPNINQPPNGGNFGGGGGGGDGNGQPAGVGGVGCVRIIWGTGRSYPATLTADRVSGYPAAIGNPAGQQ